MKETKRGEFKLAIGDKTINLLFGMRFWRKLDAHGYKIDKMDEHFNDAKGVMELIEATSTIILCAGETYAIKNGEEFAYTIDDIFDWFEEDIDNAKLEKILAAMLSTKIFGNDVNQGMARGGKLKKVKVVPKGKS